MKRIRLLSTGLLSIAGLVAVFSAAVSSSAAARATGSAAAAGCKASALSATFKFIPNSNGAGNLEYKLTIKNSGSACTLSNEPSLELLNKSGKSQPTHVGKSKTGTVTVAEGKSVSADLRFSADVPGAGEPMTGPCEPDSYKVKVLLSAPASGSVTGPISPPTPVCEHGSMSYSTGL